MSSQSQLHHHNHSTSAPDGGNKTANNHTHEIPNVDQIHCPTPDLRPCASQTDRSMPLRKPRCPIRFMPSAHTLDCNQPQATPIQFCCLIRPTLPTICRRSPDATKHTQVTIPLHPSHLKSPTHALDRQMGFRTRYFFPNHKPQASSM